MQELDFRLFLSEELQRRKAKNKKYSLRAFAEFLGVGRSTLSEILTGRRPIGSKLIKKVGAKLQLPTHSTQATPFSKISNYIESTEEHLDVYTNLNLISLIALCKSAVFRNDPVWIGEKLGVSADLARSMVQILVEKEFIELKKNGKVVVKKTNLHFSPLKMKRELVIATQTEILQKQIDILSKVEFSQRSFADGMVGIDPEDLPKIRQMIAEFRNKVFLFCERKTAGRKDTVYHLCVSFAPFASSEPKASDSC